MTVEPTTNQTELEVAPDILARAKEELGKRYNKFVALSASNLCAHCGLCADQLPLLPGDRATRADTGGQGRAGAKRRTRASTIG